MALKSLPLIAEDVLSLTIQKSGIRSYSKRYLSQNLFAGEADFAVRTTTDFEFVEKIRCSNVLFVKSELLYEVFEILGRSSDSKILLVGDSDIDWPAPPDNRPSAVKGMFIQNLLGGYSASTRLLPIGIEGRNYGRNGLPHLFGFPYRVLPKTERVVVGPFANTHAERSSLIGASFNDRRVDSAKKDRISSLSQALRTASASHVLCPRGNGMDTHRFWESIYRGSRPMALKSPWADSLRAEIGDVFDALDSFEEGNLIQELSKRRFNTKHDIARCLWPYWKQKLEDAMVS